MTLYRLRQKVVQRSQDVTRLGMVAGLELLEDILVAPGAVQRRNDGGDGWTVVVEGVGIGGCSPMALDAAHSFLSMVAACPLVNDPGRGLPVARDTLG